MEERGISNRFVNKEHINKYLINDKLTLNELKTYLRLRFKSYRDAGTVAGISENRVRQILIGYCLPRSAKLIYQIAKGWDIDPVKLTLLFDGVPNLNKTQEEKNVSDNN